MFKKLTMMLGAVAIFGSVTANAVDLPVTYTFDSEESLDGWTIINGNNDDYMFVYSADNGGAFVDQNTKMAANDRLISPAINVTEGATYKVTVAVRNTSTYSTDKVKFALTAGYGNTAEAQTQTLYKNETLYKNTSFQTYSGSFTATETGEAFFGVYVYTASYNGGCCVQSFEIAEEVALPGAVTAVTVVPADYGEMSATISWTWPVIDSFGGKNPGTTGAKIYRGTTDTFAVSDDKLVGTVADIAVTSFTDDTVETSGKYFYKIVPYNEYGASPVSIKGVGAWIGKDTKVDNPTNVVAAAVEGRDDAIALTFDLPTGSNGGYVDYEDVCYNIARSINDGTAVVIEEAWQGTLPYIDENLAGLGSYVYTVKTIYNGTSSFSGVKSNAVVTGGAMTIPYSEDFSSATSANFYTFINDGGCTRNWSYSSYYKCLDFYGGTTGTAYAITPKIKFEAGKAYELKFGAKVSSSTAHSVEVYLASEPVVDAMTSPLKQFVVDNRYSFQTKSVTLSVEADGNYYVAFATPGASGYDDLYIDDISIVETVVTPNPVTYLTADVDDNDCEMVHLSWINPDKTNAGEAIGMLDRVVVEARMTSESKDNYQVIATMTDVDVENPAAELDYKVPAPGYYSFRVTPYMGEMAGEQVEVNCTAWAGYDTPGNVTDVTATVTDEGRLIEFTPVTVGKHGGKLESELTYNIYRNDELVAQNIEENSWLDDEADLPLARYVYGVAVADVADAEVVTAPAVVFGESMALPINTSFDNGDDFELWTVTTNSNGQPAWTYGTKSGSDKVFQTSTSDSWAFTPKFHALDGSIRISVKATCYNFRYPEEMHIYLTTVAAPPTVSTVAEDDDATGVETHTLVAVVPVESAGFPETKEFIADVPVEGDYHVGFHLPTANWTLSLHQADVEQHTTGVGATIIDGNAQIVDGKYYPAVAGTLTVFNVAGVKVADVTTAGEAIELNLANGVYVAMFEGEDGSHATIKFAL